MTAVCSLTPGPTPAGVDFTSALRVERSKERQREAERFRSRRLSDSFVSHMSWNTLSSKHGGHCIRVAKGLKARLEKCIGI